MTKGDSERRNKRKDKYRERKRHPYKKGGGFRGIKVAKDDARKRDRIKLLLGLLLAV